MAVCLDYQSIYKRRDDAIISVRLQLVAAILLLVALATKVWLRIETTDLGYRLAEARSQHVELDMQRRELELKLSILLRPDNLAEMAQKRLGFAELDPGQARRIKLQDVE